MFRIGQKVVCVDASPNPGTMWAVGEKPVEQQVYTISATQPNAVDGQEVQLLELKRTSIRWKWFRAARFRPVVERKTDISLFTAMLTPSPVAVDEMNVADHAREIVR